MPTHRIDAYPERGCEVMVDQSRKTVWVASGTFQGEPLSVKAGSEMGAVRQWKEVAEARYRSS